MSKFKVGDRVRCTENYGGQFTKGKIYTVKDVRYGTLMVEFDDNGSTTNGWMASSFEHLSDIKPAIRTVTRREIVPGRYGIVDVSSHLEPGWINIAIPYPGNTASDLREAAKLFTDIADALDENA